MRKPFLRTLVMTAALGLGVCASRAWADAPSAGHPGLTAAQRAQFLDSAEQALRGSAKVSPEFWPWLKKHSEIRSGLLTSADPVLPIYAENMDRLRIALGPAIADKYAQLLLGVSLDTQLDDAKPTGSDGAYNASAFGSAEQTSSPAVTKVADYLKQKQMPLAEFVAKMDSVLSDAGVTAPPKKSRAVFVEDVAYATRTYPPRTPSPLVACLKNMIAHYETPLPTFKDKGPQWPLFPLDKAPWPLLAPLRQTLPERELTYLWDRFNGKIDGGSNRLPSYGHYTFDYEKPEIRYKQSDWNPNALPRIIEDGGVCGRLSTLSQLAQVGLGRPAVGMYQPGHRALLSYRFDPKTGRYAALREQSITTPDKSTNQWFLPPLTGDRVRENGKVVGVEYHVALALAMNEGLERYTDSRIALFLANHAAAHPRKVDLLQTATDLDPFNLEAWYAWSQANGSNTAAANQLLARMDALLASPNSGLSVEHELAANTDLSAHTNAEPSADQKRDANLVANMVSDEITKSVYEAALTDTSHGKSNRDNLRTEIGRREKSNLPCGSEVASLLDRYNIAIDGVAATQSTVTADVQRFSNTGTKEQKKQTEGIEQRVDVVLAAIKSKSDRLTWLTQLCNLFPESSPTKSGKDTSTADALFVYLDKLRTKAASPGGKAG